MLFRPRSSHDKSKGAEDENEDEVGGVRSRDLRREIAAVI